MFGLLKRVVCTMTGTVEFKVGIRASLVVGDHDVSGGLLPAARLKLQTSRRPDLFHSDGRLVRPARQQLALLVYLMLEGPSGQFERGPLMRLFWRVENDNAFSTMLVKLRRHVGEDVLPPAKKGRPVVINRELVSCDAVQFEQALLDGDFERAEHLFPDRFLTEWAVSDYSGFAHWAQQRHARLEQQHRECLIAVARSRAAAGESEQAIEYWMKYAGTDFQSSAVITRAMREIHAAGATEMAIELGERFTAFAATASEPRSDASVQGVLEDLRQDAHRRARLGATPTVPPPPESGARPPADDERLREALAGAVQMGIERVLERSEERSTKSLRRRILLASLLMAAFVVTAVLVATAPRFGPWPWSVPDTTVYAVLPFYYADSVPSLNEQVRIQDALNRWSGLTVADPLSTRDLAPRSTFDQVRAARIAARQHAGRFVRGEVSRIDDSIRVFVGLYDTAADGRLLHTAAVRVGGSSAVPDVFSELVDALLLRRHPTKAVSGAVGTSSLPARQIFEQGQRAIDGWTLSLADSAFASAARLDPEFAEAHLWSALSRAWAGQPTGRWLVPANQAYRLRASLSDYDQQVSRALFLQARDDRKEACDAWTSLAESRPEPFVAWYGAGHCLALDSALVPLSSSPTGWAFRSSYHRGILSFVEAFVRKPALVAAFRREGDPTLRTLFKTGGSDVRFGELAGIRYVAYPGWSGDSIVFHPSPFDSDTFWSDSVPGHRLAVEWMRRMLGRVAEAAVAADGRDADALELLAISLALRGDPGALDTLARARRFVRGASALRLATTELWMSLAFSVSGQVQQLDRTIHLADSLLFAQPPGRAVDPWGMAGIAALRGKVSACLAYLTAPEVNDARAVPEPLRPHAIHLLQLAAFGAPADTLATLAAWIEGAVEHSLPAHQKRLATQMWLGRAASLTYPETDALDLRKYAGNGDRLLDQMAESFESGDSSPAPTLRHFANWRQQMDIPGGVAVDRLLTEARFLATYSGARAASDWIDPGLRTISQSALRDVAHPVRAATLVRVMALRALVAYQQGERDLAHSWSVPVLALWRGADPLAVGTVESVRELAELGNQDVGN